MLQQVKHSTSTNTISNTQPPSLSEEQIEKMIDLIDANEIESIAKRMISGLMSKLKIDVIRNAKIPDWTYPDNTGKLHTVHSDKYDPSSKLMTTLLKPVVQQITNAFATPAQFIEKGITFDWKELMDQHADEFLKVRINEGWNRLIKTWDLNTLCIETSLTLNQERTLKHSELYFDQRVYMNGASTGHDGHTIKSFGEAAARCVCFI